jgi:23S rRNA-/tRNA-specific pseudouridylate synthase
MGCGIDVTKRDFNVSNDTSLMTVAEKVRDYVKNRPYVSEALENNIVNMSQLARAIRRELNLHSTFAIKAALRRYSFSLRKSRSFREEKVLRLLRLSKLMVLDNLSIVMTDREFEIINKMKIKLSDLHYVYLVEKSLLKKIRETVKHNVSLIHEDCTALVVNSPEQMETTPGVVWYLTSLLSSQNIYSLAFTSCYTETTIVIERKDAIKSYEILSRVIG